MENEFTVGSLYSGIGGLDLGLGRAGMITIWQVEQDKWRRRVLAKHWPNVDRSITDDRKAGIETLPTVDLIAGGFPCQSHSVAGKQRGADDDRNRWPEMLRIISELQPRWVLAENVPGIISTGYLETVLSDLEGAGYWAWPIAVPAVAFNAQHPRLRIFIVAHSQEGWRTELATGHHRQERWRQTQIELGLGASGGSGGRDLAEGTGSDRRASTEVQGDVSDSEELASDGVRHRGPSTADGGEGRLQESAGRGRDVATDSGCGRHRGPSEAAKSDSRAPGGVSQTNGSLAHTPGEGLEEREEPKEMAGWQQAARPGRPSARDDRKPDHGRGEERPAERRLGRGAHGIPARLDGLDFGGWTVPDHWPDSWEEGIPRIVQPGGLKYRRQRLEALGDAVVPIVAEWIGRHILAADKVLRNVGTS